MKKLSHATGFLGMGLGMMLLPAFVPELCAPAGSNDLSARELWLYVVGAVQVIIGSGWISLQVADFVVEVLFTQPEAPVEISAPQVPAEEFAAAFAARPEPMIWDLEPKSGWRERQAA